jgi:hypothetical protein
MKKLMAVFCLFAAVLAMPLYGQRVDREGKIWLDSKQGAPEINVNGTWTAKAWGKVILNQAEGSRDIVGRGDGWNIMGVVAGNKVYLLFSARGRVNYAAELTADSPNTLNGAYSRGLLFPGTRTRSMLLTK